MRWLKRSLLLGAALAMAPAVQAASAGAAGADDPQGKATQAASERSERRICRAQARTASRMRTARVCRTAAQWEEARRTQASDENVADAVDSLDLMGERISTGDTGGLGSAPQ